MADLANQAAGLLDTCKLVIEAGGHTVAPEPAVLELAQTIVAEARRRQPNDPVLQRLPTKVDTWPGVLALMQIVLRSGIT